MWVPAGHYNVLGHVMLKDRVSIRGAGQWHTVITGGDGRSPATAVGFYAAAVSMGGTSSAGLHDLSIIGDVRTRQDDADVNGVGGALGGGSVISNVFIQHTKCGLVSGPPPRHPSTNYELVVQWLRGNTTCLRLPFARNSG